MPFVPVSGGEEPRRGFRPVSEFEAPKRGFTPVQAAPAQPTPAPPGNPQIPAESAMPGVERPDIVPQPRILVAPGTRLTPAAPTLPENQNQFLPSWAPEVTPDNPALTEALSPRKPSRLPSKLLEDLRSGRRDISSEEYGGLLRQVEQGTLSLSQEDRALLQLQLPDASESIEQAARVSAIRSTEAPQILPEGSLRTGIEGVVRGLTLNNADASLPVTTGNPQADQLFRAANRAASLDEQARLAEHPIAGYGGEMAGTLVPFVKGVQMLRGLRAARGLAPVVETPGGFVAEGAAVGTPLEFLRKPEGAEQMTRSEEAEARLLQAGVGLTVGALADFTTASVAQYFGRYMARLRDERAARLLEEEARAKGFASTDDYAASLVDFIETPDGIEVRPRLEPASELPVTEPKRGFTPIDEAPALEAPREVDMRARRAARANDYRRLAEQAEDPSVRADMMRQAEIIDAELRGEQPSLTPAERARRGRMVDPDQDDIITAIRKMGGIDVATETDWAGRLSHLPRKGFGLPGVEQRGSGLTLDALAERLHEYGYLSSYDSKELAEKLARAETGEDVLSLRASGEAMEQQGAARYSSDQDWTFRDDPVRLEEVDADFVIDTDSGSIVPSRPLSLDDITRLADEERIAQAWMDAEGGSVADIPDIGELALRGNFDEMTPEQLQKAMEWLRKDRLTSPLTKLPNKVAFEEDASLGWPHVAAMDMDGMGFYNDLLGHGPTDDLLRSVGEELARHSNDRVRIYHRSGDEFAARGATAEELDAVLQAAQKALRESTIELKLEGTDGVPLTVRVNKLGISYGIDKSYDSADRVAIGAKASREAAGLRAPKGRNPGGIEVVDPGTGVPRHLGRTGVSFEESARRFVTAGGPEPRRTGEGGVPERLDHSAQDLRGHQSQSGTAPDVGGGFEIRSPGRGSAYRPGEPAADLFLPRAAADADHGAALRTLGRTVKHVQTGTFPSGLSRVSSAADVAHVVAPIRRDAQESFLAVVTNDAGDVLRIARLHRGAQGAAAVDPALVAGAITNTPKGTRAWIAHNHPSGAVAQSDADRALTRQLAGLLDGTGTRLEGGVVIGPGGRVHSAFTPDGREMTGPTRAAARREALPVTERRLTGSEPTGKPLESPESAYAALKQHGKDKEGALLLDDDNRPVGFVELSAAEMRELRSGKGGGSDRLLSSLDATNASGFIVRANSPAAAGNMHAFAEATGRTLVDVIDSAGNSLRTKGDLPTQSTFYANPFWVAGREFAKDIGAHPGRAAAEAFSGGVAGATLSDEETGSARWWLDVAAGAAGSAMLFNAARGTRLLGPGSIADNARLRLGQWIEGLPLIGRGPAELRELKTKQRLMRQILDRQTEQVGKHLADKFTPAERAMMADLIERRGIVKDLNIIHRQAQALDDYLTQITRRMKELKMLPAEMEEGGYLHRYYAKHLGLDKAFLKAKGQSLAGSYTIARGTDDVFQREFLSPGAQRLVDEFDALKSQADKLERKGGDLLDADTAAKLADIKVRLRQIGKTELHEYVGEQNGQVRAFVFAPDEAPRVSPALVGKDKPGPALDARAMPEVPGVKDLSPTDRRWSVRGSNKEGALLHRDWTKAERTSWGEIDDAGYRYVRGMAEASHDMSLATLFDTVARHSEWASDAPRSTKGKEWVQVPVTRVHKNSPLQKYGALAGKYVRPDVWNGISNYGRAPFASGPIGNVYRDMLARWKLYKTVYNPVTHFNNSWSNVEMLHMAGYSARDLGDGIRHLLQGEKSAVWREARDAGLFGTDWGSSLLKSSEGGHNRVLEELAEQLRTQPDIPDAAASVSAVMRLKEWWINSREAVAGAPTRLASGAELAKAMGRPAIAGLRFLKKPVDVAAHSAQKLYRMEDEVFKLAVFSAERRRGAAPDAAAREAQAFFFDYNDLPEGVKIIRDFPVGVPFISYTYFAIPAIARNVVQHPERVLAIAAAYEAMNYAAMVHDGMGPGEYWATVEAEDTVSPPWERGRALWGARNTIHLPSPEGYRLSLGRAHALGNPFMDEAGGREKLPTAPYVANFWGSSVFGGNPLHSILDVMANEDWKGKEIYKPGAPQAEKIRAAAAYLYQAWTPSNPAVPGSYHQQRIIEGLANDKRQAETAGGKPGLAGAVVDAANDTAALLGLQGFTGLDRMGNEILTRDALAASFGVKLRPIRWAMGQEFENARMEREIQDKERFLDAEARKRSEQRITPERFEEMRKATMEGINEALSEQRKRDQAKAKLEQQGRWR